MRSPAPFSPVFPLTALLLAAVLATSCGDNPPPPPPPPPPPIGAEPGTPAGDSPPPAIARPDSNLPPATWVQLPSLPDIDGLTPPADSPEPLFPVVVAVPIDGFPTLTQNERIFHQAVFRDWSLTILTAAGAEPPSPAPCHAAVAGIQGQFSMATQRNLTTKVVEITQASVTGNADAIHLLFLLPADSLPGLVRYQQTPKYLCTPASNPALVNRLFLPKRAVNRWQAAHVDLSAEPLQFGTFGACVEIRRQPFLSRRDEQNRPATLRPAPEHVFLSFQFNARTAGFDFKQADWHLTLANNAALEPIGVSADGGQSFLLNLTAATDCRGGATTTPVLLFEIPTTATPAKLQHQTRVVHLPR